MNERAHLPDAARAWLTVAHVLVGEIHTLRRNMRCLASPRRSVTLPRRSDRRICVRHLEDRTSPLVSVIPKPHDAGMLPGIVRAHVEAMQAASNDALLRLVIEHRLPWEAIPTEATRNPKVWAAMPAWGSRLSSATSAR
jgi:hypothetical protein